MSLLRSSLQTLLDAAPAGQRGGFVVFSQGKDLEYVQFSLEGNGLTLNWPTMQAGGKEALPGHLAVLADFGFSEETRSDQTVQSLTPNRYLTFDDGIYAQMGRAVGLAESVTKSVFERVFGGYDEAALSVNLEPTG